MATIHRLSLALAILLGAAAGLRAAELGIGSKAPSIDVEHWVQDGGGKFGKVTDFEPGKVYVVEFWATWCGPCIMSMPHIAQVQSDYADKDVQVISISDEDLDTVAQFLERDNGEGQTFDDVTKGYCLTADPDRSVHRDYMEAAGQGGIPTAFIVGKTGEIEWIGHPMEMDGPLDEIVGGSWDRAAYAVEQKEMEKVNEAFGEIRALLGAKKGAEALEMLDGMIEKAERPRVKDRLTAVRGQLVEIVAGMELEAAIARGGAEALEAFGRMADKAGDQPSQLNALAWSIVTLAQSGKDVGNDLVAAAVVVAEKGVALAPKDPSILDTLAHLQEMAGRPDEALATQKKAVSLCDGLPPQMAEQIKAYLEELEAKAKQ
jgi:thiol-disulfide isomerase/thioredoxin